MDKATAAAIRAWIKENRKALHRDRDPWALGYRKALDAFERAIRRAVEGDLDSLRSPD